MYEFTYDLRLGHTQVKNSRNIYVISEKTNQIHFTLNKRFITNITKTTFPTQMIQYRISSVKKPEQRHDVTSSRPSGVFIANFKHMSQFFPFLLLILKSEMFAGELN